MVAGRTSRSLGRCELGSTSWDGRRSCQAGKGNGRRTLGGCAKQCGKAARSAFSRFGTGYEAPRDVGAAVLVHEGQHGLDARSLGRNPANRDETKMTERRASSVESIF